MSKYRSLWEYIADSGEDLLTLSFDRIAEIGKANMDHSFLTYKKELLEYGYKVDKVSLKERTVTFSKIKGE